jgi:hypothetical protein
MNEYFGIVLLSPWYVAYLFDPGDHLFYCWLPVEGAITLLHYHRLSGSVQTGCSLFTVFHMGISYPWQPIPSYYQEGKRE